MIPYIVAYVILSAICAGFLWLCCIAGARADRAEGR